MLILVFMQRKVLIIKTDSNVKVMLKLSSRVQLRLVMKIKRSSLHKLMTIAKEN
jgi:hypothetical protein